MRNLLLKLRWMVALFVLLVWMVSCGLQHDEIQVVRIPFEELTQGAFYGGSLVYHPLDPARSHLTKGTLIAFQDITYGWEDVGNEEFVPHVVEKRYGYLYIQSIDMTTIVYDYLIYGPNGRILNRANGMVLNLMAGEPNFSQARANGEELGFAYHSNLQSTHPFLQQSQLLSFIHELPEDEGDENEASDSRDILLQESFRRMVFRIENAGKTTLHSQQGVLGASIEHPRTLVMNSAYYTVVEFDGQNLSEQIAFSRTTQLPDFHVGDYILDAHYDGVREIIGIDDDPNRDYLIFHTQEAHMSDALGTVVVEIEGNLGQIIQRYGSPVDKQRLAAAQKRYRVNLIEKSWTNELYDEAGLSVTLTNQFSLDVNVTLSFHKSWKEVSSHGSITFPMEFSSILALDAILGFETEKDCRLADPGISFTVSGVPVRISVPIDFFYHLKAALAEWTMEFGPVLDLELGFRFDVGAKIKFNRIKIPSGITTWAHASGIHSESAEIHKNLEYQDKPRLYTSVGLIVSPGVTIACVIRPQMEIPFVLTGNLSFSSPERQTRGGKLTLDFRTYGDLEIKIDVKFYKHTFKLGQVFNYRKNLYSKLW